MKTIFAFIILAISVASTVAAANVFIAVHDGIKSSSNSTQQQNDKTVLGHRIDGQGQFVLVYK